MSGHPHEPRSPGGVKPRPFSDNNDSNPPIPAAPCSTIDDLAVEIGRANVGIHEIKMALKGNDYGNKGIIPRLEAVEEKQEEATRERIKWGGVVLGAGLVLGAIKDWLFSHK